MKVAPESIEDSLDTAMATAGVLMDKCVASQFVYDFLMDVKNRNNNYFLKAGIRAIHGAISEQRRRWNCGRNPTEP